MKGNKSGCKIDYTNCGQAVGKMMGWLLLGMLAIISALFVFTYNPKWHSHINKSLTELQTPLLDALPADTESAESFAAHTIEVANNYNSPIDMHINSGNQPAVSSQTIIGEQQVFIASLFDELLFKASYIENEMKRLAQANDAEGLHELSLKINSLFAKIMHIKSQLESNNLLIMRAKILMASCEKLTKQCEQNNSLTVPAQYLPDSPDIARVTDTGSREVANDANVANIVRKLDLLKKIDAEKMAQQQEPEMQNDYLFEYTQYLMTKANREKAEENIHDGLNFSKFF